MIAEPLQRLRLEALQALELYVLPSLAIFLPWRWTFGLFRFLAHWKALYRQDTEIALEQARRMGWVGEDESHWVWQRRLVTLVDHADHYLGLTRTDAWMRKNIHVEGHWPIPGGPAVLTTFHWGTGYWGLRYIRAHKIRAHALVSPLDPRHFKHQSVLFAYASSRTRHVAAALGTKTLDISANLRPVLDLFKAGEALIALPDVPADLAAASMQVKMLGRSMRVPRGLIRLVVERKVPVWLNHFEMDLQTGRRKLIVRELGVFENSQILADALFAELEGLITKAPAFWHFWAQAERFFGPEKPSVANSN